MRLRDLNRALNIDYRRPLFQLEQWSPYLARRIWSLTPLLSDPFSLLLGFKLNVLTDNVVEMEIPHRQNQASTLIAAAESTSKILWQRHLNPRTEELSLLKLHCEFLRKLESSFEMGTRPGRDGEGGIEIRKVRARAELPESDREDILRKIRGGDPAMYDMSVIVVDSKEQQLANFVFAWDIKPIVPRALKGGILS